MPSIPKAKPGILLVLSNSDKEHSSSSFKCVHVFVLKKEKKKKKRKERKREREKERKKERLASIPALRRKKTTKPNKYIHSFLFEIKTVF